MIAFGRLSGSPINSTEISVLWLTLLCFQQQLRALPWALGLGFRCSKVSHVRLSSWKRCAGNACARIPEVRTQRAFQSEDWTRSRTPISAISEYLVCWRIQKFWWPVLDGWIPGRKQGGVEDKLQASKVAAFIDPFPVAHVGSLGLRDEPHKYEYIFVLKGLHHGF